MNPSGDLDISDLATSTTDTAINEISNLKRKLEMFELILDSIHNGVIVTDPDGIVTHFNKPYGWFLEVDPEAQIGRHCTEVVENTRMHIVAKTGIPEINQAHHIKGQDMVVQRIPIKKDGRVIAVFGQVMFKHVRDVRMLAGRLSMLESQVALYEQELAKLRATRYTFESIVGVTNQIHALKKEALRAAATHLPVLITGESGTGKELFAQAIHNAGNRRLKPFVRINCATIPKDLLESELFGYEKGAFTGASSTGKLGKFELAHQGTILLDEIGDLPLEMQPKLLRVLEEKEFERIGGTLPIKSDFRLIAATNQDLGAMIAEGRFRKDLFYRLGVIPLHIPPLRERREDILPIAENILRQLAVDAALPEIAMDLQAGRILNQYDWPGNVRELSNVLERTVASLEGAVIFPRHLPFFLQRQIDALSDGPSSPIKQVQSKAEIEAICFALKQALGNKARAARLLGIHRTLLYKKMQKYGLDSKAAVSN
ncbi:MAG: sigma 54-interacting transcriptional regulator [Deltaproteobacteria bacterium]|nr:sigma 54-interacting transcriptional regulator [Deltaproteobacteria bacterium]